MNQPPQTSGTPKDQLRAMHTLFIAIISGAVLFSLVALFIVVMGGEELALKTRIYTNEFLYIAIGFGFICLLVAIIGYRKSIAAAKDSLITLQDKLNLYRAALVRYIALCEGAALFSIIAFFLTGNYYLFVVTVIMISAMLLKWPTRQKAMNELALDWKQQQELE